jgi:hypothetical protein
MQTVDEQPETIHLYVVREEDPKPPVFPIILSALSLVVLLVFCVVAPYQQPVTRAVIRVPAVLLPLKTLTITTTIIPTGVKVYPATTAHGILTITNGSVISQTLPQGFRLGNVIIDSSVFVPAGSANGYGYATVAAHALIHGNAGNIPAYTINRVEGSSVYIRNLSAFRGGRDSYSVTVVTAQDRHAAVDTARSKLVSQLHGLHYPCRELYSSAQKQIIATWRCQFVTYRIPAYMHVTAARLSGRNVLLDVWYPARPMHAWVK